ncbi:MAG: excalibur calcium-binding domain-containing protein [Pseudomonadota bacterium]
MTSDAVAMRKARRIARADRTRRKALSPIRILVKLAAIPLLTITITMSVFVRTSEHGPEDAMRHLLALAGCDTALTVGLAPARAGELGYHARNDPDGDGVACDTLANTQAVSAPPPEVERRVGGAKFLRP